MPAANVALPFPPEMVAIVEECQAEFAKALNQPHRMDWAGILKQKIAMIRNKLFEKVCPTPRKPMHFMAHLEISTHNNIYPSVTVLTEAESPVPAVESPPVPDVIDLVTPSPPPQEAPTPTIAEEESDEKLAAQLSDDADVESHAAESSSTSSSSSSSTFEPREWLATFGCSNIRLTNIMHSGTVILTPVSHESDFELDYGGSASSTSSSSSSSTSRLAYHRPSRRSTASDQSRVSYQKARPIIISCATDERPAGTCREDSKDSTS